MKLKLIVKSVVKAAEVMLTLWSVGVCVGAGMHAGAKMDDWFDELYWDAVKNHQIKRCQRKIQKLSKKEQLTEDEKRQQKDLLAEQMWWTAFSAREEGTLGTKIVGGFDIYHKNKEETT
jgi:hypothetical protein